MSVGSVFYQTAILSSLILLGYVLSRTGYFGAEHSAFLSRLLMDICIPATVLSAGSAGLGGRGLDEVAAVIGLFWGVMLLFTLGGGLLGRALGLNRDERLVFSRSAAYPNNGFMGLPLANSLFGAQGTIWCAFTMLATNIYLFAMVLHSFSRPQGGEKGGGWESLRSLLTPLNISSLCMLALLVGGWQLPAFAQDICDTLGGCTTPLAMLVVGHLLSESPLLETLRRPALYIATLLRNLLSPLCLAVLLGGLGWDKPMCLCLVLLMGCSTASTISIAASRYNRGAAFASQALLQSNLLLPLTLPLVMALAQRLL